MNKKTYAVSLVIITTFLTSAAQILYKKGADSLSFDISNLFLNYYIFLGLLLYAIGSFLMIMALKEGEVSVLYPIVATSYIWVSILSSIYLSESMNLLKWLGIVFIVMGIALISFKGETKNAQVV